MKFAANILAANMLPLGFLLACVHLVDRHPGFAIACLIGAAITSHTAKGDA